MAAHALLSASSAKRWLMCPPSVRLTEMMPERSRPKNKIDVAYEGTMAHELGENKLMHRLNQIDDEAYEAAVTKVKADIDAYNDKLASNGSFDKVSFEDMDDYTNEYALYCLSKVNPAEDMCFVEQRVDFSEWAPEGFGTSDFTVIAKGKIMVFDLKYGVGVPVYAEGNPQLRLYALGSYNKYKEECKALGVNKVEYHIIQPRINNFDGAQTDLKEVLDWAKTYVKPRAMKAWQGLGDFLPDEEGCRFCKAKYECRARKDHITAIESLEFREPALLTKNEMETVLDRIDDLRLYSNQVMDYWTQRAIDTGVPPQGWHPATQAHHAQDCGRRRVCQAPQWCWIRQGPNLRS